MEVDSVNKSPIETDTTKMITDNNAVDSSSEFPEKYLKLSKNYEKINSLIAQSLEEYVLQFMEFVKGQIERVVASYKYKESKNSKSIVINRHINPHKLNFLVSKIIVIQRQRLNREFYQKMEHVKEYIMEELFKDIDEEDLVKNYELYSIQNFVNFEMFVQKAKSIMNNFDRFFIDFSKLNKTNQSNKSNQLSIDYDKKDKDKSVHKKYTDFSSDTECIKATSYVSDKRIKKIAQSLKRLKINGASVEPDDSSSDEDNKKQKIIDYHSDTELSNAFLSDFSPFKNKLIVYDDFGENYDQNQRKNKRKYSLNNDLMSSDESDDSSEFDEYDSDDEQDIDSDETIDNFAYNDNNDLIENTNDHHDTIVYKGSETSQEVDLIDENANKSLSNSPSASEHSNSSGDCQIIDENDAEFHNLKPAKKQNKTEKIKNIIDKNIDLNKLMKQKSFSTAVKTQLRTPIFLGMRVLALKDKFKHKWKLATLIRIESDKPTEIETNKSLLNNWNILTNNIRNKKYVVKFDSDTDDDNSIETICSANVNTVNYKFIDEFKNEMGNGEGASDHDENDEYSNSDSDGEATQDSDVVLYSDSDSSNNRLKRKNFNSANNLYEMNGFKKKNNGSKQGTFNQCPILDASCLAFLDSYEDLLVENNLVSPANMNEISLPIGSRVVGFYQLSINDEKLGDFPSTNKKILFSSEYLCSGTIAEAPSKNNHNRYLIFFDNGYCSYTKKTLTFPIFDLKRMPNDRIHPDHIKFLQNYIQLYPERQMVRLQTNVTVEVYFYDSWHRCRVIDLDCSLARIQFDNDQLEKLIKVENCPITRKNANNSRTNVYSHWIYRGSFRLYPLYQRFMAKFTNFYGVRSAPGISGVPKSNIKLNSYEEYVKEKYEFMFGNRYDKHMITVFASSHFPMTQPKQKNIVYFNKGRANKILSSQQQQLQKQKSKEVEAPKVIQGQLKHLDCESIMRNEIIKFKPHPCAPACVAKYENRIKDVKSVNPLLMPVLHGWQRHICYQSKTISTGSKKWVNYVAPCGRMLRSTGEVDKFLYLTNSQLTIDMFSFDYYIHTDREFEANAKYLKIEDITNGEEPVPVSCVNGVDESLPDQIRYSSKRIPLDGVPLVTDVNLMDGCDCKDNCRDRLKCACWRKTFEATMLTSQNQMNTNIGYRGRRLNEMVNTGVFECNSKCKCDKRCSNRVVQNGISIRLQLFKTTNKGWGLRCLDDIAKGAFICTYAGDLITEKESDRRGAELGDEYFAELDFIECLRRLTEGALSSDEDSDISSDTDSSNQDRNRKQKAISSYQRPKQHLTKKDQSFVNTSAINEHECIYLDSDEDEQDRHNDLNTEQIGTSQIETEYSKNKALSRKEKDKTMVSLINSNRFFTNKNNKYFYREVLKDPSVYIMDAKLCGNIGRYLNHSCSPNIFVQNVFVDTYDFRFPWIAFFSYQSIKAGTELCWDYNYTIDSVQGKKLFCYCNSSNCRGRLL